MTEKLGHISVGDTGTAGQNVARQVDLVGGAHPTEAFEQQQPAELLPNTHIVTTGSAMLDQFVPWYFGVAFAFLFKYCTGMPDTPEWSSQPRHRRSHDAPRIDLPLWVRVMSRRVESQLRRDWNFGYASWNLLFRATINMSRTLYSYEGRSNDEGGSMTAKEMEEGAVQLCSALAGNYMDTTGKSKPVKGDMTKLRYVPGLSRAAKRMLQNIEHTSRKVAGCQETRRQLRVDAHALRVKYGVSIFITYSPDEAHNLLMVRLSRTRRSDPVLSVDESASKYVGRGEPNLFFDESGDVRIDIPMAELIGKLPAWDERRRILARDPLASVDGFWISILLVHEHVFGMRICLR